MLRLLPGLTHLLLDLDCDYGHSWALQPDLLKTSLHAAFSLHCLRSLCLASLNFADVSELELLLSHAIGLKALILDRVNFGDSFAVRRLDFLCEPHPIILESPTLDSFDAVDAMVSSFRIVDIQHLQFLVLIATPKLPLLKLKCSSAPKSTNLVLNLNGPFHSHIDVSPAHC
jgi:hypothetical protein